MREIWCIGFIPLLGQALGFPRSRNGGPNRRIILWNTELRRIDWNSVIGEKEECLSVENLPAGFLYSVGPPVHHFTNNPLPNIAGMSKRPLMDPAKSAKKLQPGSRRFPCIGWYFCYLALIGNVWICAKNTCSLKPMRKTRYMVTEKLGLIKLKQKNWIWREK